MYNEILRKITSLTLLTILLASSAVVALPNALPQAHAAANANLFVSAENSQFSNYFAGPQVIQVIVSDPDINRLDQAYGEPTVTVNGKKLRMAQATDGNWYAYFADSKQAQIADSTAPVDGKGLNFGTFCPTQAPASPVVGGVDFSETKGVAIATNPTSGGTAKGSANPGATVGGPACAATFTGAVVEHVVRENKTLNEQAPSNPGGQIKFSTTSVWPVIQLYDFASLPSSVQVQYQKAGGVQTVNLTFDRIPQNMISTTLDRVSYPTNANVFVTMNDPQLNVDPTEEDSWTWGSSPTNNTLYYQAFDRNGNPDADGNLAGAMSNIVPILSNMMFNHNGKLTVAGATSSVRVIDFQDNGKIILTPARGDPKVVATSSVTAGSQPITFIESGGVNTGNLVNWDGAKKSEIITVNDQSIRGQSAALRYNDISQSIVGGFSFASITQSAINNTWAGGQRIPVTLTDSDVNKNSKLTEHLNLYDPLVQRMTTLKIGTPFSLSSGTPLSPSETATIFGGSATLSGVSNGIFKIDSFAGSNGNATESQNLAADESFSFRPIFNFTNSTAGGTTQITNGTFMVVDLNAKASKLFSSINNPLGSATGKFKGFDLLNYDLRSFSSLTGATGGSVSKVNIYLVDSSTGAVLSGGNLANQIAAGNSGLSLVSLVNGTSLQALVNLNGTQTVIGGEADDIVGPSTAKTVLSNIFAVNPTHSIGIAYQFITDSPLTLSTGGQPLVTDFFSTGITNDGVSNAQRINNGIYRFELEETGDNTGIFTGSNQYVMLNQLNIFDPITYSTLRPVQHDVKFVAIQDMLQAEARAPQVTYLDLGQDGVSTQISAQTDIPTHTGIVSFDSKTYKIADTVTITLNDGDLNVDNDLIDIYTMVAPLLNPDGTIQAAGQDVATDTIGKTGLKIYSDGNSIGRLLDVQFGQQNARWSNAIIPGDQHHTASCFVDGAGNGINSNGGTNSGFATSLSATGFSLVETGPSTGIFTGTFEIPDQICDNATPNGTIPTPSIGQNIKVNYVDFRDDSGKLVEVSDNAGIKGNTGSVKLDKAVYPVPFGTVGTTSGSTDFNAQPSKSSLNGVFPLHRDITGRTPNGGIIATNVLSFGDALIHIRVNDRDYDVSAAGTDIIGVDAVGDKHGPVAVQITRQGQSLLLATAGGPAVKGGKIINLGSASLPAQFDPTWSQVRDLGPMTEIAPDAGIFQADLPIKLTDGPAGNDCPVVDNFDATINGTSGYITKAAEGAAETTFANAVAAGTSSDAQARFASPPPTGTGTYCVRQGDVLTVTYLDLADASGNPQTVTDSSTFDLRNGVLQSDKSVYIIGSDMIMTLVEPDLNLDSQTAETTSLDLIEWDSHAFKNTMGPQGTSNGAFDPKPNTFVETGKDTGIFQSVIKIPKQLGGNLLERGEQIHLEYTDWGPAGSKTVGKNNQDIQLTIYTSNFGATVELDQKVYTWTDRVYITVVAPDHNFDPNLIDVIGDNDENKVTVSTRGNNLTPYKLVETGVDTGIFTGYVILQGDSSITNNGGVDGAGLQPVGVQGKVSGVGPTDGFLPSTEQDGVSVSFEFTRDQTVTGSALIRWNIGEIKWLEASYPANGQGVLQIVDPDMNLNPKAVDKFDTNVWSDSDSGGIKLTMTETGEATGIFQGTIYFTTNFQSSGNRLHVAEGDTVTGEYRDRTLPPPYTPSDQLRLTSTTFIGTVVPPLERAPASNPRIVDSFGNAITGAVKVGQQIQITADLTNGQDRDQPFAYLVQIQDGNGVTVSLSWITGTLTAGQSLNPSQSWTPQVSGSYTAQIFVWQSIDNPNALSAPLSTTINVA